MKQWEPIKTAPKDGRFLLGFFPDQPLKISQMRYDEAMSHFDGINNLGWLVGSTNDDSIPMTPPSHWMPLPEPPAEFI